MISEPLVLHASSSVEPRYAVLIHALETKQGSFVSSFLQYCF